MTIKVGSLNIEINKPLIAPRNIPTEHEIINAKNMLSTPEAIRTFADIYCPAIAIGGNRESALRSGFNIVGIQFFIYCYVGFLAGIMGVMHISLLRYSNPMYIVGTELSVIAAVMLGGARITGGTGSILGTLLGVVMISILAKNLVLIGLSSYWHQFFVGLIIIVGVSITSYQNKRRSIESLTFR